MYLIKVRTKNKQSWLRSFYDGNPNITLIRKSALKFAKKKTAESKVKMLNQLYPMSFELEEF